MLYNLFEYLNNNYDLVGSGVFQYLSFRAGMAAIFSLIISILFGKKIIDILSNFQLSENIRDLDLDGQIEKRNTYNGWNYYFNFYSYPNNSIC